MPLSGRKPEGPANTCLKSPLNKSCWCDSTDLSEEAVAEAEALKVLSEYNAHALLPPERSEYTVGVTEQRCHKWYQDFRMH